MSIFSKLGEQIASPVNSNGTPRSPSPQDFQVWMTAVERLVDSVLATGGKVYSSRVAMNADLSPPANTSAIVLGDPVVANNGLYLKIGGSGAGSWQRVGDVPGYSFIRATNAGAGTANAIVATTAIPIPQADTAALIALPIVAANTASAVTVSFNGGSPLQIIGVDGDAVGAGTLTGGMIVAGYKSGATFRLITDPNSLINKLASEAAQHAAEVARQLSEASRQASEAARDIAAGYASDAVSQGNVPIYATIDGMSAITVPIGINAIRVNGRAAAGDGNDGLFKRVTTQPNHPFKFQSAGGIWWEEEFIDPIVIYVTGQSNATNRQPATWTVPDNLAEWNYNFSQDNVGTAFVRPTGTIMSTGLGWGFEAALKNPDKKVFVINIALSGNVISNWLPGAEDGKRVYDDTVLNMPPALAIAKVTKITHMVWWQGESDRAGTLRDVYLGKFAQMITRYRSNSWFEDNTPIAIHGCTSYAISGDQFYGDMSSILMAVANADPQNRKYVDTSVIAPQYWTDVPFLHMSGPGYYLAGQLGWRTITGEVEGVRSAPFTYHKETNGYGIGVPLPKLTRLAVSFNNYPEGQYNDGTVRTMRITGVDGGANVLGMDAFGGNGNAIQTRSARGSLNSGVAGGGVGGLLPLLVGDVILNMSMSGYDGVAFRNGGGLLYRAAENWDETHRGSYMQFLTVPPGSVTPVVSFEAWRGGIRLNTDPSGPYEPNTLGYYDEGIYTPAVLGASAAGVGTYLTQVGHWQRIGKRCFFDAQLTWTAHTGTGGMLVSLPFPCIGGAYPVSLYVQDITFAGQIQGRITGPNGFVQLTGVVSNAAPGTIAMDSAGTIHVSGNYLVA